MSKLLYLPWPDDFISLQLLIQKLGQKELFDYLNVTPVGILKVHLSVHYQPMEVSADMSWQIARLSNGLPALAPEYFPCFGASEAEYGLWRDVPAEATGFVVEKRQGRYTPLGRNLFELLRLWIEQREMKTRSLKLSALRNEILPFATANRSEQGEEYLNTYLPKVQFVRQALISIPTDDGMGIFTYDQNLPPVTVAQVTEDIDSTLAVASRHIENRHPALALKLLKDLVFRYYTAEEKLPLSNKLVALMAQAYRGLKRGFWAERLEDQRFQGL